MIEKAAPRINGVLSPVVTPFRSDYSPDAERFVRYCRWLVSNNVGLAVFGTNSEGNSLSVEEREELLEKLVQAGVDPARMMPGTGCCALSDSVRLSSHAVKLGCAGVLMIPKFRANHRAGRRCTAQNLPLSNTSSIAGRYQHRP